MLYVHKRKEIGFKMIEEKEAKDQFKLRKTMTPLMKST